MNDRYVEMNAVVKAVEHFEADYIITLQADSVAHSDWDGSAGVAPDDIEITIACNDPTLLSVLGIDAEVRIAVMNTMAEEPLTYVTPHSGATAIPGLDLRDIFGGGNVRS